MFLTSALLALAASAPIDGTYRLNPGVILSEDEAVAARLDRSLRAFFDEAGEGTLTGRCVDPASLDRAEFFFRGVLSACGAASPHPPTVLKAYTLDGGTHFVTVAFTGETDGVPYLSKIVELKGTPIDDRFLFDSPFVERTADLATTTFGDVTFHHHRGLDQDHARAFVAFKRDLCRLTKTESRPLDYYVFQSLDELLKSYGFVHDAGKCNFLGHDLGFSDHGGKVFVTGTGNPNYAFEYLGEFLKQNLANADELYWPFVNGMATYYGGYGLSGDTLEMLKAQFREKLRAEPEIDFLAEFKKGRKSSVERHFSYYVMSAFLCEEVLVQHGFEPALKLACSGPDGALFFERLEEVLGVAEGDFHATILRLIGD